MRIVIGIVPKTVPFDMEKHNMNDLYYLGNNYAKRVSEAGCLPVCISPIDGYIDTNVLELCDGFVAQGGQKMMPYHFQVIHYAVETGKKYLGICLGMQLIHRYFALRKFVEQSGCARDVLDQIIDLQFNQKIIHGRLEPVEGHRTTNMPRGQEDVAKHDVQIVPGTLLHKVMGRDVMAGATFHSWRVVDPIDELKVNAWATDGSGTIEGIEFGENILGVQFHPEVDDKLPELFRFLSE